MNTLKVVVGLLGIIAGILLGTYVGFYVFLVGGFSAIISAFTIISAGGSANLLLATGIFKILTFAFAGYLSGMLFIVPSFYLIGSRD